MQRLWDGSEPAVVERQPNATQALELGGVGKVGSTRSGRDDDASDTVVIIGVLSIGSKGITDTGTWVHEQ